MGAEIAVVIGLLLVILMLINSFWGYGSRDREDTGKTRGFAEQYRYRLPREGEDGEEDVWWT